MADEKGVLIPLNGDLDESIGEELRALRGLSALLREAEIPDGDEWEDVSLLTQHTIDRLMGKVWDIEQKQKGQKAAG